jgi:phosphoglycolate phosphatase-like HAD superfamily hydrolase
MTPGPRAAVIFDVDGPLLELTPPEEDAFFVPFERLYGLTGLSRDWDSYRVRNDEEIIAEILENHLGRPAPRREVQRVADLYGEVLEEGFASGRLKVSPVSGADHLLARLAGLPDVALGMATANLRRAAEIRLAAAGLWNRVRRHPGAADGGGAKRAVLARVIAGLGLAPDRIVFIGDNLNDLDAGGANGTHFIGFHRDEARRERLAAHGAAHVSGDHAETFRLIGQFLGLARHRGAA